MDKPVTDENIQEAARSHEIASEATKLIIKQCIASGFDWDGMTVTCESVIAMTLAAILDLSTPDQAVKPILAKEVLDVMTERVLQRLNAYFTGKPAP